LACAPSFGQDLLVRGGQVLRPDGRIERAEVEIRSGAIERVGPAIRGSAPELSAEGCLVLPGLINAHYHSGENFNPGRYENLPLDLWFIHSHQVTRSEPPSSDVIYARTMLGAMQMLRSGITCVVDFLFEAPEITIGTLEPVISAYRDAGLRATVLLGVSDLPFADSLPLTEAEREAWTEEAEPPSVAAIMEVAEAAVERWHEPGGAIGIGIGPSAPQRCSDELFERSLELCRRRGLVWQTHILETRIQALTARERHDGRSFIEVMAQRGQLDRDTTLVHTVWLSDRDISLIAEHGCTTVHCPASNLRLGDGVAPVPALLRAGVRVALGTDGRGCDENLDMIELARLAALLHKVRGDDHRRWLSAREAMTMMTTAASAPAGHGERLGRLEPGARGDLILVPQESISFAPLHDPVRQLIYGASGRDVRTVVTDGRVVVSDGELTGVDAPAMLEQCRREAAEELAGAPPRDEAAQRLEELVAGMLERSRAADLEIAAQLPS
jgi:5-methylthioadenosine/S-adenosylhomocysteine deaminase